MDKVRELEEVVLSCRSTGMGAYTSAVVLHNASKIEWSAGRTHWKEKITFHGEDGAVLVVDISNRGNHTCYVLLADGTQISVCREEPRCEDIQNDPESFPALLEELRQQHEKQSCI